MVDCANSIAYASGPLIALGAHSKYRISDTKVLIEIA